MVETKDIILIGAIGAAGILGYKAIKDGVGSIKSVLPDLKTQAVDYDLADTVGKLIKSNNSAVAQLLQAIQANPGGGTVNNYYTIEGSSGELTQQHLKNLTDAATYSLESSGAYGVIRQGEAAITKEFDTNQAALPEVLQSATADVAGTLADAAGLTPAASGTVSAVAGLLNPISGIINVGQSIINGLSKKDPEPEQLPEESKASLASALLSYKETYGNNLAIQKLAKKYGLAI